MNYRFPLLVMTVLLLAAVFVACGDDDDENAAGATTSTAAASTEEATEAATDAPATATEAEAATGTATEAATADGAAEPAGTPAESATLRLGYFPNVTHAPALVGLAEGFFEQSLGSNVTLESISFNAGPSVIEALFAGEIDISYIGPNPAINGYVQSDGEALRIISGSTSGGALLIVHPDSGITTPADFSGKKIASPQLGNTQDVALRAWLAENGLNALEQGGDVQVVPTANPDILSLFQQGELDGAWVPEPWGTRLINEAGGTLFLDERDLWPDGRFVTTHVIVRTEFLEDHPDVVQAFLRGHVQAVQYIADDPEAAKADANSVIEEVTSAALPQATIDGAWSNLEFTNDPVPSSLFGSAEAAYELGFLQDEPDLDGIYALDLLNEVLAEFGLEPVTSE